MKHLIQQLIILFLITSMAGIATAANPISQTTIMTDGVFGDSVIRISYDDGTTADVLQRGIANQIRTKLNKMSISDVSPGTTIQVSLGGEAIFQVAVLGVGLDNQQCHSTKGDVFNSAGTLVKTIDYGCIANQKYYPEIYGKILNLGSMSQRGTFTYKVQEMIQLQSPSTGSLSWVRGDVLYLTVVVGGAVPTPTPIPVPTYSNPTPPPPEPTYSNPTPVPTPQPPGPGKPVIIPPAISRLWSLISSWFSMFLGLSILGGNSISATVGQDYTTQISLAYATPDSDYSDGSYQAKFSEWFIIDSSKNIMFESGWINLNSASPWVATATYKPQTAGKFYLVAVIDSQQYTYQNGQWIMVETIETKEVQEINAKIGSPITKTPPPTNSIMSGLTSWLKGLFSWLPW